ncbi:hypothetical protein [Planococcus sp. ISL-110]|uniref:hypothetical protein n=1 Tax=Planococcus sp. ISL-110 TaxID=2819167 RepID=UPI001BEB978C|nr:hypothetical protein [Planococcus sp. ISL-110]MBT2570744.1 hypothetical protein [Planococcus sp. ISL-110]
MKRFFYYFVWTLAIGLILYFGMELQEQVAERSQMTFNLFPLQAYMALFPVVIGLLIRIPKFILQLKKRKSWTFDWVLFAAIGLPALYLVLMAFVPFSPLGEGWLPIPQILLIGGTTVPTIAGLVFGYVVLESFKPIIGLKSEETF